MSCGLFLYLYFMTAVFIDFLSHIWSCVHQIFIFKWYNYLFIQRGNISLSFLYVILLFKNEHHLILPETIHTYQSWKPSATKQIEWQCKLFNWRNVIKIVLVKIIDILWKLQWVTKRSNINLIKVETRIFEVHKYWLCSINESLSSTSTRQDFNDLCYFSGELWLKMQIHF